MRHKQGSKFIFVDKNKAYWIGFCGDLNFNLTNSYYKLIDLKQHDCYTYNQRHLVFISSIIQQMVYNISIRFNVFSLFQLILDPYDTRAFNQTTQIFVECTFSLNSVRFYAVPCHAVNYKDKLNTTHNKRKGKSMDT